MRIIPFVLLLALIFVRCSSDKTVPSSVLPPEKMKLIIYDLLRADEVMNTRIPDSTFNRNSETEKLYEQVFLIYKTDKRTFYDSYRYYQSHPNVNKVLFDSLTNFASRQKVKAEHKK